MERNHYDPMKDGAVVAIRIYEQEGTLFPKAELAFAFGGAEIIVWTSVDERMPYLKGINGYTFIFDERAKRTFNNYIKQKNNLDTTEDEIKAQDSVELETVRSFLEKNQLNPVSMMTPDGYVLLLPTQISNIFNEEIVQGNAGVKGFDIPIEVGDLFSQLIETKNYNEGICYLITDHDR